MTKTELLEQIVKKQDEYIKKVDYIIGNWEMSNMILTRIRRELADLKKQLEECEESETHVIDEMDESPYKIIWNGRLIYVNK